MSTQGRRPVRLTPRGRALKALAYDVATMITVVGCMAALYALALVLGAGE